MGKANVNTIMKIVISALSVFFVLLIVALIVNLVRLSAANKRLEALQEQDAKLQEMITKNDEYIEYCQTPEFIEDYARVYLDMVYRDEVPVEVE